MPTGDHDAPPADVDVDEALVRALLADQHPDLADLPLEVWEFLKKKGFFSKMFGG